MGSADGSAARRIQRSFCAVEPKAWIGYMTSAEVVELITRFAEHAQDDGEQLAVYRRIVLELHADAIRAHRLRNEIVATKVANRLVNRLGPGVAYDLTEEEGASLQQVISAFLVAERLLDLDKLWREIEDEPLPETVRIELFSIAAATVRAHISDIIRAAAGDTSVTKLCKLLEPGVALPSEAGLYFAIEPARRGFVWRELGLVLLPGALLRNADVAMYMASQIKSNIRELEGSLIRLSRRRRTSTRPASSCRTRSCARSSTRVRRRSRPRLRCRR